MQKTKIIAGLCAASLLIAVAASASGAKQKVDFSLADSTAIDNVSCRYAQPESETQKLPQTSDLSGYELKAENSKLALYYRAETATVAVLNKSTGYLWTSLSSPKADDLNDDWNAFANSIVTVDYLNDKMQSARYSARAEDIADIKQSDENSVVFSVKLSIGISLDVYAELSEDSLRLSVPYETIKESKTAKIQSLFVAPFLGAVSQDSIDGYMFIPDGSGALIRYNKSRKYISPYEAPVYGADYSVDNLLAANDIFSKRSSDYLTDVASVTVPVFGAAHGVGKNAFLSVIDGGAEHSTVYASPSGYVIDYSWVCARFDYRKIYYTPVNNNGGSIADTQIKPEKFSAAVSYYFLENNDADYTGMALKYRSLLEKDGALVNNIKNKSENIPMYLNVVASDVKKTFTGKKSVSLTSGEQAADIIASLESKGINNLTFVYNGWQKGGLSLASYGNLKSDKKFADKKDIAGLKKSIEDEEGRFYLGLNAVNANEDQIRPETYATLTIYKELAKLTSANSNDIYTDKYFIRPDRIFKLIGETAGDKYNYFFGGLGASLYGDYTAGEKLTRSAALKRLTKSINGYKKDLALENPNVYLWKSTTDYFNMAVNNSQFLFETDSVPFLSILLSGSINHYAPYANQAFYSQSSILKMVEYGTYPSFIVMGEQNDKLSATTLANFFSLNFNEWDSTIEDVYSKVNGALKHVIGEKITDHKVLSSGVVAVTYESGTVIYVNYSNLEFNANGNVIKPQSYLVKEG